MRKSAYLIGQFVEVRRERMCNLYNVTTNQQGVLDLTRAMVATVGNLEPSFDVYPDHPAPIVRNRDGQRELVKARWGMPTPPKFVKGKADGGVTNIRNVSSPHWRRWLGVESRCVVPATSFSEYGSVRDASTGKLPLYWFALSQEKPLFFFAGIWGTWKGVRKIKEGEMDHELFGFLTCEPNGVVAPIHQKAMPVILRNAAEVEQWLTAPASEALELQRPLPDDELVIMPKAA
jgi:putative SOS response-associated peptidase YedK